MIEHEFVISGRIPSKKNSRISTRSGRSFPSRKYTDWHQETALMLRHLANQGIDYPVAVHYYFYLPDNRRTDLSNKIESINDLLVDINFIEDDNVKFITQLHVYYMGVDRKDPRCEVAVSRVDPVALA